MWLAGKVFMSLHLKLLDIDHPLTFEESKLRQIEAHALIYLRLADECPTAVDGSKLSTACQLEKIW